MSLLEVSDLAFGYAGDPLFSEVTFRLDEGDRGALVAPNGIGKTTLLRLVAGELTADRGAIVLRKGARVAFYRQSHEIAAAGTVLDALMSGFSEILALGRELSDAQHAAASGLDTDLKRLAEVTDRHHAAQAGLLEQRVSSIATRLGFPKASLDRPVASLSGGERGRAHLGAVLAQEPDLLLLDEPTNHLDLDTIRWLESVVTAWRGAVLVVSHDRAFLDASCPMTMELGRRRFRVYSCSYAAYETARVEELERERKLADEQAAFVAKTEDFIRKNLAGQKTKQAQSRRRMLEKLERIDDPEDVWRVAERVRFRFADAPRSGDIVLEARGLGATRGGRRLFSDLDLLIRRKTRLGIVGKNGCGKTTLLRLLAGTGDGGDDGALKRGANLREGYFDQHLGSLDVRRSAIDEIRSIRGDLNVDGTREYLARFRFWGEAPFRKVESLSGGERSRLALAKLLLEPRNLLFLDEPTNHLDIPAVEILEEALCGFEGTVVTVSHDRRFLEKVTTRIVSFTGDGTVDVLEAGFADLERAGALPTGGGSRSAPPPASRKPPPETPKEPADGARRHEALRAKARETERKQRRLAKLETDVAAGEARLKALRAELREAPGDDWERLSVGSSRVDLQACKLEYSIVSPK